MMSSNPPPPTSTAREWTIIVLFLALIIAPGIGQIAGFTDAGFIKMIEYRTPSKAPQWPSTADQWKKLPKKIESFVNDHFGFRAWLSTLNSWSMVLLGSSGSERIVIGKSGWLFFDDKIGRRVEEHRGTYPITDAELDQWIDAMDERRQWIEGFGAKMVIAVFPSKKTIYPEYLPDWMQQVAPTRFDRLLDKLASSGKLVVIDTRPAVLEAKAQASEPLYYLTDTHWNSTGAFVAYGAVMDELMRYFPTANQVTAADVSIGERSNPSPAGLKRILNVSWAFDEPIVPSVHVLSPIPIRSSSVLENGRWRECTIREFSVDIWRSGIVRTTHDQGPRVLIFRDSFTSVLIPLFNSSFKAVLYDHHNRNTLDKEFVRSFEPDLVLYNLMEESLFFPPQDRSPQDAHTVIGESLLDRLGIFGWSPSVEHFPLGCRPVGWIEESGFYQSQKVEGGHARWTNGSAKLSIPFESAARPRRLEISFAGWGLIETNVEVRVNGQVVLNDTAPKGLWSTTVSLEGIVMKDRALIEILGDTFVPAEVSDNSDDTRTLGIRVFGIRLLS